MDTQKGKAEKLTRDTKCSEELLKLCRASAAYIHNLDLLAQKKKKQSRKENMDFLCKEKPTKTQKDFFFFFFFSIFDAKTRSLNVWCLKTAPKKNGFVFEGGNQSNPKRIFEWNLESNVQSLQIQENRWVFLFFVEPTELLERGEAKAMVL